MSKYRMTDGTMIEKKKIDRKVSETKHEYYHDFIAKNDYPFCERTKRSDLGFDCSHIISVKECQNMGKSELAWCIDNIELLCREAHMDIERWPNAKRMAWYYARKDKISYNEFIEEYEK